MAKILLLRHKYSDYFRPCKMSSYFFPIRSNSASLTSSELLIISSHPIVATLISHKARASFLLQLLDSHRVEVLWHILLWHILTRTVVVIRVEHISHHPQRIAVVVWCFRHIATERLHRTLEHIPQCAPRLLSWLINLATISFASAFER